MDDKPTLLITLIGRDRPGVTRRVRARSRAFPASRCSTSSRSCCAAGSCSASSSPPHATYARLTKAAEKTAADLGMDVEVVSGEGDNRPRREGRAHVTVLGHPLRPAAVAAIAGRIADTGANIDRIVRMARYPVTAIEFNVSGADDRPATRGARHRGGPRSRSTSRSSASGCSGTGAGSS